MIKGAMRKSMPYIHIKPRTKKPSYWSHNLTMLRRQARKLECESRRDKNNTLIRFEYVAARNKYKNELRKAKEADKKQKINSIKAVKEMSKFVKVVNGYERQTLGMLETGDSNTETVEETLELLLNTHFPGSKPANKNWRKERKHEVSNEGFQSLSEESLKIITPPLVKKALMSFGKDKSAGPDEIKP